MSTTTRRVFSAIAALALVLVGGQAARAQTTPADPLASAKYLVGSWTCSSVSDGKTTTYTAEWAYVPGGRWMQATNRSGTHVSFDFLTYDVAGKQWRTVDLEPDGSMSVLLSTPGASAEHMPTQSVYPDDTQKVTFDSTGAGTYKLSFDFLIKGKHELWEDDCAHT
jgi:hypothetical protein